jgi:acyl-CoA hydrolase
MVAVDEHGRPVEVAPLEVATAQEERRQREAQVRRANRLAERKQMMADRDAEGEQVGGRSS